MERKFIVRKEARPYGPPPMAMPGGGGGASPGAVPSPGGNPPASNITPNSAPKPPGQPGGGATPQGQPQAPSGQPGASQPNSQQKPPQPGQQPPGQPGMQPPGKPNVPTNVNVDAATGHVTIQKGPVNIVIAKNEKEAAGEFPPHGYDTNWAPEEYGATDPGSIDPGRDNSQFEQFVDPAQQMGQQAVEQESPPVGKYGPGESVKYTDPDDGLVMYGVVNKLTDDGMYEVNFPDGQNKTLHELWLMPAPEAANAEMYEQQQQQQAVARFFKSATTQEWKDFRSSESDYSYGDWGDEKTYSKDTHDNPFSHPKNRLEAPKFDVKGDLQDFMEARQIAYALQTQMNLDVTVEDNSITVHDVENPLSMITELSEYGIDASTVGDNLTKYDQGFDDLTKKTATYKIGQPVKIVADWPDMNYFYNSKRPAAQAMIVGINKEGKFLLRNDQRGTFEATEREISA